MADDEFMIPSSFAPSTMGVPSSDPDAITVPISMLRAMLYASNDAAFMVGDDDDGDDGGLDLVY